MENNELEIPKAKAKIARVNLLHGWPSCTCFDPGNPSLRRGSRFGISIAHSKAGESSGQTKTGTSTADRFTSAGATLPFSPRYVGSEISHFKHRQGHTDARLAVCVFEWQLTSLETLEGVGKTKASQIKQTNDD
ncbi:hypothetical protein NQZ68_021072 [Dissostichus eleginoides]|nr:hypothetical protein NQZ68_021072 [Dissostichus eleginoides]